MDAEHECKLESLQLYEWCISEEDGDSTSMDELLEASETFGMSQATSPNSCTLLLHVDPQDLLLCSCI